MGEKVFEVDRLGSTLVLGVLLIAAAILIWWTPASRAVLPREESISTITQHTFLAIPSYPHFTDVTESAGVGDTRNSIGVAFGDIDNDGYLEIYVSNNYEPNRLYHNNGDNTFTDIALSAGVADVGGSHGVVFGDIENDGDLDLFVVNEGSLSRLYRNDGNCRFTDITGGSGIALSGWGESASFGDVDGDGNVDLFVTDAHESNFLLRNHGDNTFADITSWAGVSGPGGGSFQGIFGDIDGDGDLDLYVVNRGGQDNTLYENDGTGRFTDVTHSAGVPGAYGAGGAVFGDYDNDGDLDLFVTHGFSEPDILYRNDGEIHFTDVTNIAGVGDPRYGCGAAFGDVDHDGDLDLYIGNAWDPNRLYMNNGDGTFTDVTEIAGVGDALRVYGLSFGDTDSDGDLDIYGANYAHGRNVLYRNDQDDCDFLKVRLVGTASNKDGIGSKVMVYDSGHIGDPDYLRGFREVCAGSGHLSMNSLVAHFGLSEANRYDVQVTFPSGCVVESLDVAACQTITIVEVCELQATIDIAPDVLNLKSRGRWITAYIELPSGYDPADIDVPRVYLEHEGEILWAEHWPTTVGDHDGDGILDRMVKFDRQEVIRRLLAEVEPPCCVELWVRGELHDRTPFAGSDTIRVIRPPHSIHSGSDGSLIWVSYRNPFGSKATIRYSLPFASSVSLKIHDLSGRLVRTLVDGERRPGLHSVEWDGRADDARLVANGIYLCRMEMGDWALTEKMTLVR